MQLQLTTALAFGLAAALAAPALAADTYHFNNATPNNLMAMASDPSLPGHPEIEAADDFVIPGLSAVTITHATFYGLIPTGATFNDVTAVNAEIYRVFPQDSTFPPSGRVPTRANSPSDVALAERDSSAAELSFSISLLSASFTANNSVLNGINPMPGQRTSGEGPVTGQEVLFDVSFAAPISLLPGHYFFVPQVGLSDGDFYWLSASRPISGAGTTPFTPDLQTWIRNGDLAPDWLRVGTDIVGGDPAPTFNAAFTLDGKSAVPDAASTGLLLGASAVLCALAARRRP